MGNQLDSATCALTGLTCRGLDVAQALGNQQDSASQALVGAAGWACPRPDLARGEEGRGPRDRGSCIRRRFDFPILGWDFGLTRAGDDARMMAVYSMNVA
jgi:hypothetical protein